MRVIYALPTCQHRSLCELLTPSPSQPWFSHPAIGVHMRFALQALWQFFSNLPACYRATAPPGVSFSQTDSVLLLLAQPSLPPKSPVTQRVGVPPLCSWSPSLLLPAADAQGSAGWHPVFLCSLHRLRSLEAAHSSCPRLRGPCLSTDIPSAQPRSAGEFIPPPKKEPDN